MSRGRALAAPPTTGGVHDDQRAPHVARRCAARPPRVFGHGHARHDDLVRAPRRQGGDDRRRAGLHGQRCRQGQRAQGAPHRRRHPRGLRRVHGRRLHAPRAPREEARGAPRPAHARVRRSGEGVAHGQVPAAPRGAHPRRGPQRHLRAHGHGRRPRAHGRRHGHRQRGPARRRRGTSTAGGGFGRPGALPRAGTRSPPRARSRPSTGSRPRTSRSEPWTSPRTCASLRTRTSSSRSSTKRRPATTPGRAPEGAGGLRRAPRLD